ncbi:MAG: hypothetical protein JSU87_13395 [Gemmatimonadota bacterium]|nr:MAG: hypothetical protein JSU87_13395 [Gemmatimonadota bacterium]
MFVRSSQTACFSHLYCPAGMAGFEQLYGELKRRRVFRVAVVYAAVAFVLWQAAEIAVPALNLPDWALTLVVLLSLLGFPLALVLGWAFDITQEGVRRTESPSAVDVPQTRVPRWFRRLEAAAFVFAAVLLLIWAPWDRGGAELAAFSEINFLDSVAVLPIENQTGDASLDQLCAGITDEIVGQLRRLGAVKISDPYSVERLQALGLTTRQIADSLGVHKLILGSLYGTSADVSLSLRVSDSRDNSVLSTGRYPGDPAEGFNAAVSMAGAFVERYLENSRITLASVIEGPSPQGPGYESYLIGKTAVARRTAEGLARAREAFNQALAQNPDYAYALSGLSRVYSLADTYRYQLGGEGYQAAGFALAYANRAIELEPNLADAYSARLLIARRSLAPVEEVAADCERTIALEPAAADGLSWCAQTVSEQVEVDKGFRAAEQAIALDPQAAGRRVALAYIALQLGRFERAAVEARMAWQLEPALMLPRSLEAWALLLSGEAQRCTGLDLGPHAVVRATCLSALGQTDEAQAIVDSVAAALRAGDFQNSVFTEASRAEDLAGYYAWIAEPMESLAWLRRAYELSPTGVEPRLLESALFDRVRSDPVFDREVEHIRSEIWPKVLTAERAAYSQLFERI